MTTQDKKNINKINNISDYLSEIDLNIKELKRITGSSFFCYRGEDRIQNCSGKNYKHSMPNIFRPEQFEKFDKFKWFEKSILDEIRSNNLSNRNDYLEIAMDAQHGGFPSRLLDVTFNSLIALFFAITPHYNININEHDNIDGRVMVYAIDKMSTSNTESIIDIYKDIVHEKKYNSRLESYFHMLIDFVDLNSRIKAQQGGFILFGGNQHVPIPEMRVKEIIIPKEAKEKLRQQLDLYFGINMGMIYPEPDKKVDYITSRALIIENDVNYYSVIEDEIEFNLRNKLEYIKFQLQEGEVDSLKLIQDLAYYIYDVVISIESLKYNKDKTNKIKKMIIKNIEHINSELYTELSGNLLNPEIVKE